MRAKKRFGQHFLADDSVIDAICDAIQPQAGERLVEIGPGQGALTEPLLASGCQLDVIEVDQDLLPGLAALQQRYPGQLTVHAMDVLTFDWAGFCQQSGPVRVVGNLPYNISTPLLTQLLPHTDSVQAMYFMLQHEVGQRLAAPVNHSARGRLSILAQYYCEVYECFEVPPEAFAPPPKVLSAVLQLLPHAQRLPVQDMTHFIEVVKAAFSQRRKTIRNTLKAYLNEAKLVQLGIAPELRPQALSVAQYVAISNALVQPDRS